MNSARGLAGNPRSYQIAAAQIAKLVNEEQGMPLSIWLEVVPIQSRGQTNFHPSLLAELDWSQIAVDSAWNELLSVHGQVRHAAVQQDYVTAFTIQVQLMQMIIKFAQNQKEKNWFLPVFNTFCRDLRLLAAAVEYQVAHGGTVRWTRADGDAGGVGGESARKVRPGDAFEKAAECLRTAFRMCASDQRSTLEETKRWGLLYVVNQLLKVYFRIDRLQLCPPLVRAIDAIPATFKQYWPFAQQVTYNFYLGKTNIFDGDYAAANEHLSFAFQHCLATAHRNKRAILLNLIPVRILLGYLPARRLLEKYSLVEFVELTDAVRIGNVRRFNEILKEKQTFFVESGIYLLLEKVKLIVIRNLFKRIYLLYNNHIISLEMLTTILVSLEEDVTPDETMCLLSILISENKLKGYISFKFQKLVLSKQNPFPSLCPSTTQASK